MKRSWAVVDLETALTYGQSPEVSLSLNHTYTYTPSTRSLALIITPALIFTSKPKNPALLAKP